LNWFQVFCIVMFFFLCCFVKTICNLQDSSFHSLTIFQLQFLSKLSCTYTWVVICELVLFCIALVRC
jgi:hypothetical protein